MGNGAIFLTERRYETGRYEESWEKLEGMEEKGQENEGEAVKNTRKHTHTHTQRNERMHLHVLTNRLDALQSKQEPGKIL